jgi:uncharacterized membrane protein YfcA
VISTIEVILLIGAGVVAGAIGSAGGITSLIAYPALLAVGIAPLPANVTMAVAFVACFPGSALGSRSELQGQGWWLRRWALLAGFGGAVGMTLLLVTPRQIFDGIVPFLLAAAAIVLLIQPQLSRWRENHHTANGRRLLPIGLFAVAVYNGYFGSGAGIMVLALMLLTVNQDLPRANALKNMLLGIGDVVAAIGFILFGPVHWKAAAAMAIGLLVGSFVGPSLTRRILGDILRVAVALLGFGLAVWLFATHK